MISLFVIIVLHDFFLAADAGKLTQVLFKSSSIESVSSYNYEVNLVVSQNFLKLVPVFIVLLVLILFTRSEHARLTVSHWSLSRWKQVQEVFMSDELSKLIYNSDGHEVVSVVDWMHNGSHYDRALSLRNDVFILALTTGVLVLLEASLIHTVVAGVDQLSVLLGGLLEHKLLSVFFELVLDFIHDAHQEGFLASLVDLGLTDDFEDLESKETPLGVVVWKAVHFEHLLEIAVANLFIWTVISDLDIVVDKTLLTILEDLKE